MKILVGSALGGAQSTPSSSVELVKERSSLTDQYLDKKVHEICAPSKKNKRKRQDLPSTRKTPTYRSDTGVKMR